MLKCKFKINAFELRNKMKQKKKKKDEGGEEKEEENGEEKINDGEEKYREPY